MDRAALIYCSLLLWNIASLGFAQSNSNTRPAVGIQEHRNESYSLVHATVIPEPGKKIESATLVIREGRIAEIGAGLVPPSDTRVIDMTGKTIYAGFVDMGIEMEAPAADRQKGALHWNAEVTPERSMGSAIQAGDPLMSKLRKAGITTALVAPRDGIIKGTSAVVLTSGESATEAILRDDVAMHVRLTVSRGRGRDSYPGSPMGAVALARQTFFDAQWYAQAWQVYHSQRNVSKPEKNDSLHSINRHVEAGKWVMMDALNEQYALRADAFAREFGLNAILRGSGQEYQLLEPISKLQRPVIVPLNFPKPPNVSTADAALDVELEELMHWELAPENAARLSKAGVKIALTSNGLTDPSEFIPQIRKAIARGLNADDALRAITTTPAALLDIDDSCGAIKPGAWANLVITKGELWNEKTKIEEVWVKGNRPAAAFTESTSVDGEWKLALAEQPQGSSSTKELLLTLADSSQKISGSLSLLPTSGAAPAKEPETRNPNPDVKGDDSATEKPSEKPAEKQTDKTSEKPAEAGSAKAEKPKKNDEKGKVKLKSLKWEDLALSASFPASQLVENQQGVGYIALTLVPKQGSSSEFVLVGNLYWPDGQNVAVVASKIPADAATKTKEDAEKTKPAVSDAREKSNKDSLSPTWYPVGAQGRHGLPEQPEYVVFQNTTLWTCGPQGILRDADLVIHRGRIHQIGVDLAVPNGAQVIDGSKLQLSPGLIDCHSHMATDSGINESTQAVTAEVRIADFVDASDITIYRQLAGGLTTANVLHGSANPIGGQNQVIKLRWGGLYDDLKFSGAPAGIKFALGENVKRSNAPEGTNTRYPQSRMGVEQLFRDRFNAAIDYDRSWKQWNQSRTGLPPRRDLELEAIAEILRGERWIHCHSYRQDEILAFLRVLEDYHVTIGSLQHILEGYKIAEALAKHGATASSFSDWWNYKFEVLDAIPFNGAIMHKQGIVVSFNSDDAELGRHMNHEAAKAIKYGNVEPMEALKFVTLNPAKQLRIDNRVGSLEIGKDADIAVWNGSPLSTLARCEQTWIDGRKYFDRQWDRETRLRDTKLFQSLVQKILDSGEASGTRSPLADDPSRLWPHHDEFCHHHHDDDDDHHDEELDATMQGEQSR
jgi:N-acetylglucosamine-6-phosphate deacetylase